MVYAFEDLLFAIMIDIIAGSVKKGEDEHDQAVEILDTIRS